MSDPVLHVVAGPNGAGKTTFYAEILGPVTHLDFVNADAIAAERWPEAPHQHAYEAADLAASERSRRIKARESFATQTQFSHASKVTLVREAEQAGYVIVVHVVLIPEDLAVARVASRVGHGGHDVPEDKVRARFHRLWGHPACRDRGGRRSPRLRQQQGKPTVQAHRLLPPWVSHRRPLMARLDP